MSDDFFTIFYFKQCCEIGDSSFPSLLKLTLLEPQISITKSKALATCMLLKIIGNQSAAPFFKMNSVFFEDISYIWKPPFLSFLRLWCYRRWIQVSFIIQKIVFLPKISHITGICGKLYVFNSRGKRSYFCLSTRASSFVCKQRASLFE